MDEFPQGAPNGHVGGVTPDDESPVLSWQPTLQITAK
jgi:hypothetical protein